MIVKILNDSDEGNHFRNGEVYLVVAISGSREKCYSELLLTRGKYDTTPHFISEQSVEVVDNTIPDWWTKTNDEAGNTIEVSEEFSTNFMKYADLFYDNSEEAKLAQAKLVDENEKLITSYLQNKFKTIDAAKEFINEKHKKEYQAKGWDPDSIAADDSFIFDNIQAWWRFIK